MDHSQLFKLLNPSERLTDFHNAKNAIIQPRDVDGMFHPSSFGGCRRRLSYAFLREEPRHRIPPKLRATFSHGHALHEMLQGWMHEVYNAQEGEVTFSFQDEVSITSTSLAVEMNIAGSADGLIVITREGEEDIRIVYEAKSASNSSWAGTGSPRPNHVQQANVYAACLDAHYILFDYYNKDKDTHKHFLVPFSQEIWDSTVVDLNEIVDKINQGELMPRESSTFECRTCGWYYTCQPEAE